MRRGFVVLSVVVVAVPAAAELWLRASGGGGAAAGTRPPPVIEAPERPRAAPLLIVGGSFTAAAGLPAGERWSDRLASRVTGATGFSEVIVGAPLAEPGPFLEAALATLARTPEAPSARGLNALHHERGPDVVVLEAGGDALGGDPAPFVIARTSRRDAVPPAPEARRRPLALLEWFDRWRAARALETDERAVEQLVATDGFVAGAAANARLRLEELTAAVASRRPDENEARFLRALIGELHGLHRIEARERSLAQWKRILGRLRMEQRPAILLLTGPSLLQVGLEQVALSLAVPIVHAPPCDLDPRLRVGEAGGRAAAAVHAEVADAVRVALTKRGILPAAQEAPADVALRAEAIESAAHARGGIDESLITLAHTWLLERCEIGATTPPEALFGVGERGRLAPGVPGQVVLKRPALPEELVVTASVKAGSAPPPRLKVRHANGELLLEPKPAAVPSGGAGGRTRLEYRAAAPTSKDVVAWPAFELTVVVAPGAADPQFELAAVELTRSASPPEDSGR